MTAQRIARPDLDDPLTVGGDPVEVARAHIAEHALAASPGGRVGLELELHLVDLARPDRHPDWSQVQALSRGLPAMPSRSLVTFEPGGQIELSTPPTVGVAASVTALRTDREALGGALREAGLGAAPLGADPARPVRRVNPGPRYVAMETHFDALGYAGCGSAMMSATAALQVNLDAGPAAGWEQRLDLVRSMVPMLVAASSTSPYLGGRSSGWHSMRQGIWQGIDHGRSDPLSRGEPTAAWARYALSAPVMMVRDGDRYRPVTRRVSLAEWLEGVGPIGRRPTLGDVDYHLSTLFPPVRPRGYLEIRCLDALPDRWWPALAAMTATLLDDPVAADLAADLCAPAADSWETAARDGMADAVVRRAVTGCVEVAARRCPVELAPELADLAELVASGGTPADELRARADRDGPLLLLEEEARA